MTPCRRWSLIFENISRTNVKSALRPLAGEIDQAAPIGHRHEVAIDEMKPAAAPPVEEDIAGQGVELGLADHIEAAQADLLAGGQDDARLVARHQRFAPQD